MANISKEYFARNVCSETPCSVLHPWSSNCFAGLSTICLNTAIGCSKFFAPIYLLKIILNWKKINKDYLRQQIYAYIRTLAYGTTFGAIFFGSTCFCINFLRYHYHTLLTTGFLGGISILIECQENRSIDTILFFNQVLEAVINYSASNKIVTRTRLKETIAFMFISSLLMYLFKTQKTSKKVMSLWFYPVSSITSEKVEQTKLKNGKSASCRHKESCFSFCYKGGAKYFVMGYILEIIKSVLPRLPQTVSHPERLPAILLNRKNICFGLFFGGYVAIYRYVTCFLLKMDQKEVAAHALIAGFVAGCTYYFRPNIQIPIIGFTTALQLLSQRIIETFNLPQDFPYSAIVFCVCSGILMHYRFVLTEFCPKYTKNMINITTNNLAHKIHAFVFDLLDKTDLYTRLVS